MNANMFSAAQALGGGILIGLASWLLLASMGRVAGISGIAASALVPSHAERGSGGLWRWAFLLGLIGGGAAVVRRLPLGCSQTWSACVHCLF